MDNSIAGSPRDTQYATRRYARLDVGRAAERAERPAAPSQPLRDPSPAAPGDVLLDLEFGRLFSYLARRKYWIGAAIIAGALAGYGASVLIPARYTASTEVLVDPGSLQVVPNDLYTGSDQRDAMVLSVESKMRVLTSGNVFGRVIDDLDLTSDPEFTSIASLSPRDSALKIMQERVKASRDEKSFVVTVSATTNNAEKSVRVASAMVGAFRQDLADSASQDAGRAAAALTDRLASLKTDVTKADAAVEDFKRAHDLQTSQGELTSTQTMTQVNSQLLQAQAKLIDLKSRYDKLGSGDRDSQLSAAAQDSTTISALRAQYAAAVEQANALKATLGPLHPNVRTITAQVAALQSQIGVETARMLQSAKSDVEQAQAAVEQLQAQADSSKSVVVTDNSAQVALRELEREAASRAAIYEAFLDRAKQITEREQIDTTNIRTISEPVVPTSRSWPPPALQLAALGAAAGLALAAIVALGLGLLEENRRGTPRRAVRAAARPAQ